MIFVLSSLTLGWLIVRVNLPGPTWLAKSLSRHFFSWCAWKSIFGWDEHLVDGVKKKKKSRLPFLMWVALIQTAEGLTIIGRLTLPWIRERSSCSAFKLEHWFFPYLWTWTEINISFPGSLVCQFTVQTLDLSSSIIAWTNSLWYIPLYIYVCVCDICVYKTCL